MTYQQSLENIERLKNIVWPMTAEHIIFFDFNSNTEFQVIYFKDTGDHLPELNEYMGLKMDAKLPIANIGLNKDDMPEFYYNDGNIMYLYNLLTNTVIMDHSNERFIPCAYRAKLEIASLVRDLKNMRHNK